LEKLLRETLPAVKDDAGPERDLWPALERRINSQEAARPAAQMGIGWACFDGALLAGLVLLAVSFPATIPLLLYYL